MKYDDFKKLFEQKFYTMKNNRIIECQVDKVILCKYNRDEYGNVCPMYNGHLDVEFVVTNKDCEDVYCVTINKNQIGKEFFTSITDLVNYIKPK